MDERTYTSFKISEVRNFARQEILPRCRFLRGACVLYDEASNKTLIAICGNNVGTCHTYDCEPKFLDEVNFIRAELELHGVEEVMYTDMLSLGYVLIVEPKVQIEKKEIQAEGCWAYTSRGEIELGHLLQQLNVLVWRAWMSVQVPRIEKLLEEDEQSGESDDEEYPPQEDESDVKFLSEEPSSPTPPSAA